MGIKTTPNIAVAGTRATQSNISSTKVYTNSNNNLNTVPLMGYVPPTMNVLPPNDVTNSINGIANLIALLISLNKGTPEKGTPEKGTPEKGTPEKGTPEKGSGTIGVNKNTKTIGVKNSKSGFEFDKSNLTYDMKQELLNMVKNSNGGVIVIQTSPSGSKEHNEKLALARQKEINNYLDNLVKTGELTQLKRDKFSTGISYDKNLKERPNSLNDEKLYDKYRSIQLVSYDNKQDLERKNYDVYIDSKNNMNTKIIDNMKNITNDDNKIKDMLHTSIKDTQKALDERTNDKQEPNHSVDRGRDNE